LLALIRRNAGLDDKPWAAFVRTYSIILALILCIIAVISLGYFHLDEHFQTIEFASYKLGRTAASDLAWEFPARVRPWLQPFCYVIIAKIAALASLTDPFALALIFRLFSAFFAWLTITALMFCAYQLFSDQSQRKVMVRVLALFCLLPYYMVRTSSESLSSSFSMMGFALLILGSRAVSKQEGFSHEREYPGMVCFITGILWGLAFEFRYQAAFLAAGFILWIFFISIGDKKTGAGKVLLILCGILLPVVGCTFIDSWGYGAFTIAPWNYIDQNILQGRADEFGTFPVWSYFLFIVKRPTFFPIVLTAGTVVGMWRFKKNPLTWAILVFFVVHSLIGHKELRFLLNLLIPALFMTVYACTPKGAFFTKLWKLRGSLPAKLLYVLNLLMLLVFNTKIEQSSLYFDRYIYRHTTAPFHAYSVGRYIYDEQISGFKVHFYRPAGITIDSRDSLDTVLREAEGQESFFLITSDKNTVSLSAYGPYRVETLYRYEQRDIWSMVERVLENESKFVWTLYRFVR
jgi:phosphatidylinositol glycan class B